MKSFILTQKKKSKKLDLFKVEKEISSYKTYFKNHLSQVNNRKEVLSGLDYFRKEAKKIQPRMLFDPNPELTKLEVKIDDFLKENFDKNVKELYNKEIYDVSDKVEDLDIDKPFLLEFFRGVSELYVQSNIKNKKQWEYKINVLNYLYESLYNCGLHSNIDKRSPEIYKRFNLVLYHDHKSNEIKNDCRIMMTYKEFEKSFLNQYSEQLPIKMLGKLIPFDSIYEVKIATTLMKEDEIELFALKNNFEWSSSNKDYLSFINLLNDETEKYHSNPYEINYRKNSLKLLNVDHAKELLTKYPTIKNLYSEAIDKFKVGNYDRNVLDDLRLVLEELLRIILNNNKPLEKQLEPLGEYQKENGKTKEVVNIFRILLNQYIKFQNDKVKHRSVSLDEQDVSLFINLTTSFIIYLIED